jgi:hypothetical protein
VPSPVIEAVADAARRATYADAARVLSTDGASLQTLAISGTIPGWRVGATVPADEKGVGFVVASAQALSVGAEGPHDRPGVCVPLVFDGEPIGALELLGRPGGNAFGIEATDTATLFARIAATAIASDDQTARDVPSSRELASELARLETGDPVRYASVARAVSALLV